MVVDLDQADYTSEEFNELLRMRQDLLDKLFARSLEPHERRSLTRIRWALDRVEDARQKRFDQKLIAAFTPVT